MLWTLSDNDDDDDVHGLLSSSQADVKMHSDWWWSATRGIGTERGDMPTNNLSFVSGSAAFGLPAVKKAEQGFCFDSSKRRGGCGKGNYTLVTLAERPASSRIGPISNWKNERFLGDFWEEVCRRKQ